MSGPATNDGVCKRRLSSGLGPEPSKLMARVQIPPGAVPTRTYVSGVYEQGFEARETSAASLAVGFKFRPARTLARSARQHPARRVFCRVRGGRSISRIARVRPQKPRIRPVFQYDRTRIAACRVPSFPHPAFRAEPGRLRSAHPHYNSDKSCTEHTRVCLNIYHMCSSTVMLKIIPQVASVRFWPGFARSDG